MTHLLSWRTCSQVAPLRDHPPLVASSRPLELWGSRWVEEEWVCSETHTDTIIHNDTCTVLTAFQMHEFLPVPLPLVHPGSPISASFHPTQSEKHKYSLHQCDETRQADHEREQEVIWKKVLTDLFLSSGRCASFFRFEYSQVSQPLLAP